MALGTVSLLTDVSSEMVTAFLPLYLVYTLQVGYVQFGLLDGLYTGATAVLRLVGGHAADRLRRPKTVAGAGYGLSALTRIGLLGVGASGIGIGLMVAIDRAGKGLRTAPRDAMIAAAVQPERLGRAFGVHRTMDTIGALLGPLATFLILVHLGTGPTPVFVVSFCFALLGLLVLAGFVPASRRPSGAPDVPGPVPSLRASFALVRERPVRRAAIVAAVLGVATLSDAFVYLLVQRSSGVSPSLLPLMPLGVAAVFLALATPMGWLADRLGRKRTFLAGHVVLLGVYLTLLVGLQGTSVVLFVLALHGLFYASTDGVLSAWIAQMVPECVRSSGLAVVQTAQALGRFASSVVVGVLLTTMQLGFTMVVAAVGLAIAISLAGLLVHRGTAAEAEGR